MYYCEEVDGTLKGNFRGCDLASPAEALTGLLPLYACALSPWCKHLVSCFGGSPRALSLADLARPGCCRHAPGHEGADWEVRPALIEEPSPWPVGTPVQYRADHGMCRVIASRADYMASYSRDLKSSLVPVMTPTQDVSSIDPDCWEPVSVAKSAVKPQEQPNSGTPHCLNCLRFNGHHKDCKGDIGSVAEVLEQACSEFNPKPTPVSDEPEQGTVEYAPLIPNPTCRTTPNHPGEHGPGLSACRPGEGFIDAPCARHGRRWCLTCNGDPQRGWAGMAVRVSRGKSL